MKRWLIAFACLACATAGAMTMERDGATLLMSGIVSSSDRDRFKDQLDDGTLRLVILSESAGGDLNAAMWIAHEIRNRKINTAVDGLCASACAIIFMGGEARQMLDGENLARTRLGFHGAHKAANRRVSERDSERMRAWLYEASNGKFNGRLLDRAITIHSPEDMMFFYYPRQDRISAWFCAAGAEPRPSACDTLRGIDILKAGILTTTKLLAMDVPAGRTAPAMPPARGADDALDEAPAH